jgi:Bacteriophage head to tail connecting protein
VRSSAATAASRAPYEDASARILSLQPPIAGPEPQRRDDWPDLYQHLEGGLTSKRSWRYSWWQHWAILAQYLLPYRYHWVIAANTFNRGFPVNDSIINETAMLDAQICASGLFTGMMSPSRPWMRLSVAIESWPVDSQGDEWLDDSSERILAVLGSSNWYSEWFQAIQDEVIFGTGPGIIYEDAEDVIRVYIACAGEYFCSSGARNDITELWREFTFTVRQIVGFFRLENCPEEVRLLWERGGGALDQEFVVAHAIEPNFAIAPRAGKRQPLTIVPASFPYREVYWLRGRQANKELWRRGYPEKPFFCLRWSKTSNDPYGRGPGMDALGGSRQLQQQERRNSEYIEKMVRPPMGADASLENKPSSILPGEITFMDASSGKQQMFPLFEVNPQGLAPMKESIERVEARIHRAFKTDLFLMISQMEGIQPRNQIEILERKGEKIQQIGPVIELFEQEVSSAIQRVMAIMARRGLLRPPPPSLRGAPIGITYTGQLKMLQMAAETAAMERTAAMFGSISESAVAAGVPNPMRIVKWDDFGREYSKRVLLPARLLYTDKEVAQHDEQREQKAAMDQAAQVTPGVAQVAQTLSKTPVGAGQSALSSIIGGPGPNQ